MAVQVVCQVADASDVGVVRRHAVTLAQNAGFGETDAGRVAIVATELATNLARHAGRGQLLLQPITTETGAVQVEFLSIDSGPGMDAEQCLRDGYSSAGTAGQGLGAIRRLSAEFEIYSRPGNGCVVLSRVEKAGVATDRPESSRWRWGVICTPAPGEVEIGDTWRLLPSGQDMGVLVADGLGHGPLAAQASGAAARVFEAEAYGAIVPFFTRAHGVLRSTRGAAVAVAACPGNDSQLTYCSVGNVMASILTRAGVHTRLMSHNGTVGAEMRPARTLPYEWCPGDRFVVHSDGLSTRWSLKDYPELMQYHPAIVGAVLFRDHVRGKDDATVLVLERRE